MQGSLGRIALEKETGQGGGRHTNLLDEEIDAKAGRVMRFYVEALHALKG